MKHVLVKCGLTLVAAVVLTPAGSPGYGSPVQTAPGTPSRPVLSAAEAQPFTSGNYLDWSGPYTAPVADPWQPGPIQPWLARPDVLVGPVGGPAVTYTDVQAAVNAVYALGGSTRRYIALLPGTYTDTVFIPAGTPPLTVYGVGAAADVKLQFSIDATSTPAQWAAQVNATGRYAEGDPAWPMFASCATKTSATVGLCATVVWSQSADLQLYGLTIVNTLPDLPGTHQALALRTEGDRTQVQAARLISRQDTFYANDSGQITRLSVRDSYIEGDTDFVFGRASAVFEHTEFRLVSVRKPAGGVIFSPDTLPGYRYGFLVQYCRISADNGYVTAPTGHFGRAWDQGASSTGYLPGVSPNGQLVIRNSELGPGFDVLAPWAPAATTSRPFMARIDPGRDLNDPNTNRLWEYGNIGASAAR